MTEDSKEQLPTAAAICGQDHTLCHRHALIQTVTVTITGPDDDGIWGGLCPPPFFIESLTPSTTESVFGDTAL